MFIAVIAIIATKRQESGKEMVSGLTRTICLQNVAKSTSLVRPMGNWLDPNKVSELALGGVIQAVVTSGSSSFWREWAADRWPWGGRHVSLTRPYVLPEEEATIAHVASSPLLTTPLINFKIDCLLTTYNWNTV